MSMPILRVYVDVDGDRKWTSAKDDVTARVMSAEWNIGMRKPYQSVSDESRAKITLDNSDQRFSPEFAGGFGSLIQRRVRIAAVLADGMPERPLWTGWVQSVALDARTSGSRQATLECASWKSYLQAVDADVPLLENVTAPQVISEVFDNIILPPGVSDAWAIGVPGQSEIGVTTTFFDINQALSMDAGLTSFPFVGDTYDRFSNAWAVIELVTKADRARTYLTRDGKVRYANRSNLAVRAGTNPPVPLKPMESQYAFGDELANDIRYRVYPRALSASATDILWKLDTPLALAAGLAQTLTCRFSESGAAERVSAKNVAQPTGADFASTGGTATITSFTATAREARLTLFSPTATTVTTLIVRGRKLTSYNTMELRREDSDSVLAYGRRVLQDDLRLATTSTFASNLLDYELERRSIPKGRFADVTLALHRDDSGAYFVVQTLSELFYPVRIAEAHSAHDSVHVVIGEEHRWSADKTWMCKLVLERGNTGAFWLMGVAGFGEMGVNTYMGL